MVHVKLARHGKAVLSEADLYEKPDEDDVLETERWSLMKVFDPHLHQGMAEDLFEGNEIKFKTAEIPPR